MVIIMDNQTGITLESEFGSFEDEVLGANWMPRPEVSPQLIVNTVPAKSTSGNSWLDVDAFLRNMYLSQE
jgi:hypothetical protein